MAIITNLYPPIVATTMPAFIAEERNCRIYFSISQFNIDTDIANVQVIIRAQNSNQSMLNRDKYPCEIKITELFIDDTKTTDDKYYIEISKNDMIDEKFEINQYYKVQIRFTHKNATTVSMTTPQAIDNWLVTNLEYFSEWSSVCLIRGISKPELLITGWEIHDNQLEWSLANTNLTGQLKFADSEETDRLQSYQIKLLDDTNAVLTDSGILFSNTFTSINSFNYKFKYNFQIENFYRWQISYSTVCGYSETIEGSLFQVIQTSTEEIGATILATPDLEKGAIRVLINKFPTDNRFSGTIVIRRSEENTNFTIWEDVAIIENHYNQSNFTDEFIDTTIESGVKYKYYIQTLNNRGERGIVTMMEDSVSLILDDMFLSTAEKNLKIQYNPSISSYKKIISETKTETIGSQYPFIKRNGYMNYAQFPISGLITIMEDNYLFAEDLIGKDSTKKELDEDEEIIEEKNIYIKEREYRKEILTFLQDNTVKLFRSTPEGNILIKLMDVSLSPDMVSGRRIWTFSATAYEIDSCSVDNYNKYNILPAPTVDLGEG